jgi:hypothetical protein
MFLFFRLFQWLESEAERGGAVGIFLFNKALALVSWWQTRLERRQWVPSSSLSACCKQGISACWCCCQRFHETVGKIVDELKISTWWPWLATLTFGQRWSLSKRHGWRLFNHRIGSPSHGSHRRSLCLPLQVVSSPEAARVACDGVPVLVVEGKDPIAFHVKFLGSFSQNFRVASYFQLSFLWW